VKSPTGRMSIAERGTRVHRGSVAIAGIRTWIVSCEDLILSKLVWAMQSNSELQRRDVHQLLAESIDIDYIRKWVPQLCVTPLLNELMP
jgi:hypothetical protein